jgi:hypothetical protein
MSEELKWSGARLPHHPEVIGHPGFTYVDRIPNAKAEENAARVSSLVEPPEDPQARFRFAPEAQELFVSWFGGLGANVRVDYRNISKPDAIPGYSVRTGGPGRFRWFCRLVPHGRSEFDESGACAPSRGVLLVSRFSRAAAVLLWLPRKSGPQGRWQITSKRVFGRGEWIRTTGLLVPNHQA